MNYLEAVKQLKKGKTAPIILLYGEEQYLIETVINQIIQLVNHDDDSRENVVQYDLEETSIDDVLLEVETYPFFSEHKIVIADHAYFLTAKQIKTQVEHNVPQLVTYLSHTVDFTTLILIAPYEKLDERKKITKELKKQAMLIHCEEVKAWEVDKWVKHLASKYHIHLDKGAEQLLINETGTHLALLEKEIEKLALYVGKSGNVTMEIAQDLVSHQGNATGLTLVDMVIGKNLKGAISVYRDLTRINQEPIALIGLLASQLRTIYQVKILLRKGYRQQQIAKHLRVHPYVVKMSMEREKRFTTELLSQYIEACAQADQAIKQGKMEKDLAFEFLLYQLIKI